MLFTDSIKRFKLPKDWYWVSINEIAKLSFSSVDKKSVEGEKSVRLCNYMDVFYNRRIREGMPFMNSTASDSDIRKFTLNKGDVVLTKDSETPEEIAFAAVIDEEIDNLVCGYHLAVLHPDKTKITGEYLMSAINFHPNHHQFVRLANGATRFGLGIDSLNNALIPLPPFSEQRKIAEILRTWDEAIETAEAELKAKQERKRWLMDKAFFSNIASRSGNSVLLGSIAKLIKGKKPELHDNYSEGAKPYLVAKYIRGDEKPKYAFLNDKNAVSISPSDIVIICDGSNSGEMFSGLDGVLSSTMAKLYLTSGEFEQAYVQFFVAYNGDKLTDAQEGGAIPHLDRDKLLKLKLYKPTREEQLKIVEVLNSNYDSITNIEKKLELLRLQKRGLMQKLLTGEIRVVL
jgi:type I restriction enzyme, S subunit